MVIILAIYGGVIYLVFGRFKLLPWNKTWKSVSAFVGLMIALMVVGALNYLAPADKITVLGQTRRNWNRGRCRCFDQHAGH